MLWLELGILCALFFLICYLNTGSDEKNLKSFSSYPDEIQAVVREHPAWNAKIKTASPAAVFVSNVLLFSVILLIFGFPLRSERFVENFGMLSILGQGLNAFDLIVIDLLWWRNSPRVRFSGTEHLSSAYRAPQKHIASFIRGIAAFLAVAVIDGFLLTLF